jgi:hypothetical protein
MNSLADRYFAPEVPTRLAALRVLVGLFGTVFLAVRTRYLFDVARLPPQRFDAVGPLSFLDAPLDVHVVQAGVVLAIALGAAFTLGWRHRITGPLYAVLLVVVTTYDNSWQHIAHTENLFALHTLVLGFAPSADAWSLDARRRAAATNVRHPPGVEWDPHEHYGWPVRLITAITVCTYALAGWAKLRNGGTDWITGDVLRNQIANDNVRKALLGDRHSPLGAHLVQYAWAFPPLAFASMLVELGAPLALLNAWARRVWVVAAWLFHVGVLALMAILFIYPLTGIAFASFGHPDELWRRVRARGRTDRLIEDRLASPYRSRRA